MKKAIIILSIIALSAGTVMQAQTQVKNQNQDTLNLARNLNQDLNRNQNMDLNMDENRNMNRYQDRDADRRGKMSFGVRAGLNVSNVWDANGEDFVADPKTGYAAGVFLSIPLGKVIGFQPEVLISQKGFKGGGTLLGTSYSDTKTTTFIDIPLQLQIKPASFMTLVFGPQFSYLLMENNDYTFGTNGVAQEEAFDLDNIRKNILGFGFGVDFNISRFLLSGRLGWDLQDNHGDGTSSTPRYKNQWAQVTFGFKL